MDIISLINFNSGLSIASPLMHHIISHEIMHSFFSLVRKKGKRRLTRAQRRRLMNRKRRWFTDNIIMHHKRLHDKNRQITIDGSRANAMARKLNKKENLMKKGDRKWRDRVEIRDRGKIIRGRVDARRLRARSRWLSVAENSL
jgi:hypothetical protein